MKFLENIIFNSGIMCMPDYIIFIFEDNKEKIMDENKTQPDESASSDKESSSENSSFIDLILFILALAQVYFCIKYIIVMWKYF